MISWTEVHDFFSKKTYYPDSSMLKTNNSEIQNYPDTVYLDKEYLKIRYKLKKALGHSRLQEFEKELAFQKLAVRVNIKKIKLAAEFIERMGMDVAKKYLLPEIFTLPEAKDLLYLCEGIFDLSVILSICKYLRYGFKYYAIMPVYQQGFPLETCELIIENRYEILTKGDFEKAYSTV